jgi:cytochrome c
MLLAAAFATLLPVMARAAGDAEAGKTAFNRRCGVCHGVAAGQNKIGPSLHGVVGRPAGQVQGFNYSPAMKGSGKTWDEASIDTYLKDPKSYVPGNRMILAGLNDDAERQNIIAYLATQR